MKDEKFFRPQIKIISLILAFLCIIPAFMLIATFDTTLPDRGIARSYEIQAQFDAAARLNSEFYHMHARLPTQREFHELVSIADSDPLMFSPPPFEGEILADAKNPPSDGFKFDYWRGESMEHYFSWKKSFTLKLSRSPYFIFDNQAGEALLMFVLLSLGIATSILIWPKNRQSEFICPRSQRSLSI